MTSHRSDRLRVAAPTLEPDPVFLDMLAGVGASSVPATPRTARSAGLRLVVATATVAAIASATWAAGHTIGGDVPLSPADRPTQEEPSRPPSPGNVGTPQPDVPNPPGSPLSPGLPGTPSFGSERAVDPGRRDQAPGPAKGQQDRPGPNQPGGRPSGRPGGKPSGSPGGDRDDARTESPSDDRRGPRGPGSAPPDRVDRAPQR